MLIALVGALAGSAGFALLVVRRQNRRLAALAERLANAQDEGALVALDAGRIRDPRLRAAFRVLADRVVDTWRLATVDPLTGIANRQAVLDRARRGAGRAPRATVGRCRSSSSTSTTSSASTTPTGTRPGTSCCGSVGALLAANVRTADTAGR